MTNKERAIEAICRQQEAMKQKTNAFYVGEQLKEMVRAGTEGQAQLVADDLEHGGKSMSLVGAEKKIAEYARKNKQGNCGCCPPQEAERILREFYGLGDQPGASAPTSGSASINLLDFM